ncbi:MAG: type III secretion system cytoplasmic ring protein SctQ [Zoogloeaceae bacterium]|jgi:type III secretion system YscQ/HrcQ family protein|nr:type III secretion system cytoplasmic ring protein SctQ [Zoogloeaceae bacterium]
MTTMARPAAPYRPFALTPGMARLCDVLGSRAALAGGEALFFHFDPAAEGGQAAAWLDLEAGGFSWRLECLDLDFLATVNEAFAEMNARHLPEDFRRAALLYFLHPFLTHLENLLDVPIQAIPVGEEGAFDDHFPPLAFTLKLTRENPAQEKGGARHVPLRLRAASEAGADWLAGRVLDAFPETRTHPDRARWRLPATLQAAAMQAPLELLENLAIADILIPPEYPAQDGHLKLILGDCADESGFCLDVSDGRAVVTDFYRNKEARMDAPENPPESQAALAALEVPIRFELEKKLLPLAEIEALSPGKTFTLGVDPLSAVTVTLHGQPLAAGRLVDLGGTLGVQITRLIRKPPTS